MSIPTEGVPVETAVTSDETDTPRPGRARRTAFDLGPRRLIAFRQLGSTAFRDVMLWRVEIVVVSAVYPTIALTY